MAWELLNSTETLLGLENFFIINDHDTYWQTFSYRDVGGQAPVCLVFFLSGKERNHVQYNPN